MTPPNGAAEPAQVAGNVAGAPAPVTPTTPEQPGEPAMLSVDQLASEFAPAPAPTKPAQPEYPDSAREADRKAREAAYKLRLAANLKKVERAVAEGTELDDAIEGLGLKDTDGLKARIRKLATGEDTLDTPEQPIDIDSRIKQSMELARSEERAKQAIMQAMEANGLNVQTAQAQAQRKALIDEFTRLSKANSPEEAAQFAIYKAGLTTKKAMDDGYESGFRQGAMGVPPAGYAGTPRGNTPQVGQPLTAQQLASMTFEQLQAHDRAVAQGYANAVPLMTPSVGQGNPNLR